ncbi:HK97 family phage prohead protease [Hyalangium sp.]|uniref:HK97 family phage prohead protease n=1 Tax=Hyalangium sp. TaxID=2028555 RepID=UPI002D3C9474|nr:HK97 family phage prohead protease [Hyalangium sp.]HYI01555.1 HK97 family phage prohead protease [Hyalangium sp.]
MSKPQLPTDSVIKSLAYLTPAKAEGGKPVFRMSTEVLDRHRDRVKPAGLKTENYLKNPVLLWNHQDWDPAIGVCRVFQEGAEWFMEPTFDGIGERSTEVAAKVAAGTLRTCSIRFRILKHSYNEEGGLDYDEVELLEVSITNIPANPEAERVKNQNTNPTPQQKSNTTPEATASKALEQADVDVIRATVDECLKPLMEKLVAMEALIAKLVPAEASAEEEPEKGADTEDGIEVELSAEEAEEMKAFFTPGKAKS